MSAQARCILGRTQSTPRGEIEGEHLATRPRLAVQQGVAEAGRRFHRMSESVAEIEQLALAAFALVGGDDRGLDAAACDDRMTARRRIAGEQRRAARLQPGKEIAIADWAACGGPGIAGRELAPP